MIRLVLAVCLALALTLCLSAVSSAHKVNVFCFVDGDTVVTDSGYSRSKRVQGGTIEAYDASSGALLLTGTTDNEGHFEFPVPDAVRTNKADLRVVLKASAGHQAEWVVPYNEFGNDEAVASDVAENTPPPVVESKPQGTVGADEVEAVVRRELAPVKRMLADLSQSDPGITEILGGIGYIFGLFGVAAYMKSRQAK